MSVFKPVAVLIFLYVSYTFFTIVGKEKLQDATEAIRKYRGYECPSNTKLFKLSERGSLYKIQVAKDLDNINKLSILRCEKEFSQENVTEDVDDIRDIHDSRLFDDACNHLEYATFTPDTDLVHLNNSVLEKFFSYWLEIVKGPAIDPGEPTTKSEEWAVNTLVQGIFPGTRWCGFGNIAEDMYSTLGDHSQADACCRAHDLCRPIIRAFQFKYYYQNPSVLPVSHCKCDMDLYNCLMRVNSPTSKMIGKIFFNLVKMRCFDFDLRNVCVSRLFGFCLKSEKKCTAVLKNNKIF